MADNGESGDSGGNSQADIVVELMKVVEPVVSAFQDGPLGVAFLLDDMGISEEVLGQDAGALYEEIEGDVTSNGDQLIETVVGLVSDTDDVDDIQSLDQLEEVDWKKVFEEVDPETIKSIVESGKAIYDSLSALEEIDLQLDEIDASLGDMMKDYLLVRYLRVHHGGVYGWCKTFDVIRSPTDRERPEEIDLQVLVEALQDPNEIPKEVFNWAAEEAGGFLVTLLLERLLGLFWRMDVPANLTPAADKELTDLSGASSRSALDDDKMDGFGQKLTIPLIGYQLGEGDRFETGVKIVPLPPDENRNEDLLPGVALVSYGTITAGMSADLGGDWTLTVDGDGHLANRGVAVYPKLSGEVTSEVVNVEGTGASTESTKSEDQLVWTMNVAYAGGGEDAEFERTILGTMAGQLDIRGTDFEVTFEYANDAVAFGVELTTTGIIVVDPQGGFLDKVIPEPISYEFEVSVGWSTESGFYVQSGGSLEVALADNIPLGPLQIKETFLGVELPELGGDSGMSAAEDGKPPALPLSVAGSPELDLGFMTARVNRMGLKNNFTFPEGGGDLGPADHDLGFRPPDGIALSVDAGPVSGGGVLNFYPEENRYSGALQLQIGEISISAVGLLKTELPGGRDGYSLLLLITAEFPPIQLGFGFTLNGLGGILGIHRSMKTDPLGDAIRSGNVSSILFPQNVVENADRIISDLRSIFPPTADQHVVGPMAKFGWGTPTLLKMELGVILQFPTFKIAIVGAFHFHLPDEAAPLVELHLAVVGVIDPPNKKIAIDASLYDSRIVMWTVSGDMAMRLYYGEDSRFLLSIGGFHPRYDAPSGFPELDRVKASLSAPGGNPRLEYKGYLATTPNTFQVGAGVYLHAEAGPASVKGQLSFDALFQFDPFKFVIDFMAKLAVKIAGKGLELSIDGTLKGPGPFRVTGTVTIDIMFISVTANIDATIGSGGDDEGMPSAKVMPELVGELEKGGNWSAQLPETGRSLVTITEPGDGEDSEDGPVLVHPLGGLGVRQQTVPLKEGIDKYGNAVPSDYRKFRIAEVRVDDEPLEERSGSREKFAPAKFKKMSDSEKMNSPPFVKREAGMDASGSRLSYPGSDDMSDSESATLRRTTTLEYETSVVDEERANYAAPLATMGRYATKPVGAARIGPPLESVPHLLKETAVADADLRQDFVTVDEPVYGTPGGQVIGKRVDRSDVVAATADDETERDPATDGEDDQFDGGLVTTGKGVTTLEATTTTEDNE